MTTTSAALTSWNSIHAGLSVVFEGTNLGYTTVETASEMATAWTGTFWTTWKGGLYATGTLRQEIDVWKPKIADEHIQLRVLDKDGTFASTFLKPLNSSGNRTTITANVSPDDTAISVKDTTGFASSGTIYIGHERITYSGKTSTSFTGCTRATGALWTKSGGGDFAYSHRLNALNGFAPIVSDYRREWYNLGVQLWLHHRESGIWSTKANAKLIYTGRIKAISDEGDGSFLIDLASFTELLRATLLQEQVEGPLQEGMYLPSELAVAAFYEKSTTASVDNYATASLDNYDQVVVAGTVADDIISEAITLRGSASLNYHWHNGVTEDGHVRFRVSGLSGASIPSDFEGWLSLPAPVWTLLGWDPSAGVRQFIPSLGVHLYGFQFRRTNEASPAFAELVAPGLPVVSYIGSPPYGKISLDASSTRGTWQDQPTESIPTDLGLSLGTPPDGFLQVGESTVFAVARVSDTEYSLLADVTKDLGQYGFSGAGLDDALVRYGEPEQGVTARQIWIERGPRKDVILRLLLSTGVTDYNTSTYDKNPVLMGAGVPYSAVDVASFESLGDDEITLVITSPEGAAEILISEMAVSGRHLVVKDGALTLVQPRFDGGSLATAWSFDETNKAKPDERVAVRYSPDNVINRVELQYDRGIDGRLKRKLAVEDTSSLTDYNQRRTVTVKGITVGRSDANRWIDSVASVALSMFSRPQALLERSCTYEHLGAVPGETATLTDNYVIDPATGERGITSQPCWILGVSHDLATLQGSVQLVAPLNVDASKFCAWAPAADVDEDASNAGYVVVSGSSRYLALKAHAYSGASESVDASHFAAGDLIRVQERGATSLGASNEFSCEVESVDTANSRLYLTAAIGSWDTALKYSVVYDTISSVVTAQKAKTFIADDTTDTTGDADHDSYLYGGDPPAYGATAAVYTDPFWRFPSTADDTGEPLSVHHWYHALNSINNYLGYKTRNVLLSEMLQTQASKTGTGYQLVYGPVWMPDYDPARTLTVRIRGSVNTGGNTADYRVHFSTERPTGSAYTSVSYGGTASYLDLSQSSTTTGYVTDTVTPVYSAGRPGGCWVAVEMQASAGGVIAYLDGVEIIEGAP